jgi:indole-3-glycerol phosphate synthase
MHDALENLVRAKRREVADLAASMPIGELRRRCADIPRPRNFFQAVVDHGDTTQTRIIAEIKRRSPSGGPIREDLDAADIARQYHAAGAAALCCATDASGYGGSLAMFEAARAAVPLPVMRSDLIVDLWQVWESRAAGADAILLVAEALRECDIIDFQILAVELGMTTLLEIHDVESYYRVKDHIGFPHPGYALLGINNRDLDTDSVSVTQSMRMADLIEDRSIVASMSGIATPAHLDRLRAHGICIALVGESLLRQPDPGAALRALLAP